VTDRAWDVLVRKPGAHFESVSVLEARPGLFRRFAAMDWAEDEAILEFANEVGSLTGLAECEVVLPDRRCGGERLSFWRRAIRTMRRQIELWEWARAANGTALRKCFAWDDGREAGPGGRPGLPGWWYVAHPGEHYHVEERVSPLPDLGPNDLVAAARVQVAREITEGLARGQPVLGVTGTGFEFGVAPRDLLGAMYVQFARATVGDHELRKCAACDTWFEIAPRAWKGKRAGAKHCGPTCRQRARRLRMAAKAARGKKPTTRPRRKAGAGRG
jgi:hypothetical protein